MPKQQIVEVSKGDFGRMYHLIGGVGNASNRPVNPARVKAYGKVVDDLAISHLTLIQRDPHTYYIADGQHRIQAISTYGNGHAIKMPATIYAIDEIEASGRTVAQFISDPNKGRAFTGGDRIAVHSNDSRWPAIFAKYGLAPSFRTSRANGYTWPAILAGRLAADHATRLGRMSTGSHTTKATTVEDAWLTYPEDAIEETAKALAWWHPVAEAARTARGIHTFSAAAGITIGILLYAQNRAANGGVAQASEEIAPRVVRDPALPMLTSLKGMSAVYAILRAVNYRQAVRKLTLFGLDGREEQA